MSVDIRVPVLMYHRVGEARNSWEARFAISPERFAEHMRALAKAGFQAVSVDALYRWLDGSENVPENSFVLTFDDGFKGVYDYAFPVLKELGWPFTVFMVSSLIGGQDEWTRHSNPDKRSFPLLAVDEIKEMQARNCSFQSHTRSHPKLPTLDDEQLADELEKSREDLSELLGCDIDYFAYPYGLVDARVEKACREAGYRAAFSTRSGFNRGDVNPFLIRRLEVYGTDTPAMLMRKVKLGCNEGTLGYMAQYYWSRVTSRLVGARQ